MKRMQGTQDQGFFRYHRRSGWFRLIAWTLVFCFGGSLVESDIAHATLAVQAPINLSTPQANIFPVPASVMPPILKGISVDPKDPFKMNFAIDLQDQPKKDAQEQVNVLIKYFLSFLALPEEELWVNLSPYEKDRIITPVLEVTDAGRQMLTQDYVLKQMASALTYPESELGKKFWQKILKRAKAEYGTSDIPVNSFSKVWVVPDQSVVYEEKGAAFISESHLKVLVEEDYLSTQKNSVYFKDISSKKQTMERLSSEITRDLIVPELQREVNEGKAFAPLRQMYNSLILAIWFKERMKDHLLNLVYSNQKKTEGINLNEKNIKEKIYAQYLKTVKKGVYSYVREDYDDDLKQVVPRKYFSGGFSFAGAAGLMSRHSASEMKGEISVASQIRALKDRAMSASLRLAPRGMSSKALMSVLAGATLMVLGAANEAQAGPNMTAFNNRPAIHQTATATTQTKDDQDELDDYAKERKWHLTMRHSEIDPTAKTPQVIFKAKSRKWLIQRIFSSSEYDATVHYQSRLTGAQAKQVWYDFLRKEKARSSYLIQSAGADKDGNVGLKTTTVYDYRPESEPEMPTYKPGEAVRPLGDNLLFPPPLDLANDPLNGIAPLDGDKPVARAIPVPDLTGTPGTIGSGTTEALRTPTEASNETIVADIMQRINGESSINATLENGRWVIPVSTENVAKSNWDDIAWKLRHKLNVTAKINGLSATIPVRVFFSAKGISIKLEEKVLEGAEQIALKSNGGKSVELALGNKATESSTTLMADSTSGDRLAGQSVKSPQGTPVTKILKPTSSSEPLTIASTAPTSSAGAGSGDGGQPPPDPLKPTAIKLSAQPTPVVASPTFSPTVAAPIVAVNSTGSAPGGAGASIIPASLTLPNTTTTTPIPTSAPALGGSGGDDDPENAANGTGSSTLLTGASRTSKPGVTLASLPVPGSGAGSGTAQVKGAVRTATSASAAASITRYVMPAITVTPAPYKVDVYSPAEGYVRFPDDPAIDPELKEAVSGSWFFIDKPDLNKEIRELKAKLALERTEVQRYTNLVKQTPSFFLSLMKHRLEASKIEKDLYQKLLERSVRIVQKPAGSNPILRVASGQLVDGKKVLYEYSDPNRFSVDLIAPPTINLRHVTIEINGVAAKSAIIYDLKPVSGDPSKVLVSVLVTADQPMDGSPIELKARFFSPGLGPDVLQGIEPVKNNGNPVEVSGVNVLRAQEIEFPTAVAGNITFTDLASEGGEVKAGDVVAQVDIAPYQQQLGLVLQQIADIDVQLKPENRIRLGGQENISQLEVLRATLVALEGFIRGQIRVSTIRATSDGLVTLSMKDQGPRVASGTHVVRLYNGNFTVGDGLSNLGKSILLSKGTNGELALKPGDIVILKTYQGEKMPAKVTHVYDVVDPTMPNMQSVVIEGYDQGAVLFDGQPIIVQQIAPADMDKIRQEGVLLAAVTESPSVLTPPTDPNVDQFVLPSSSATGLGQVFLPIKNGGREYSLNQVMVNVVNNPSIASNERFLVQRAHIETFLPGAFTLGLSVSAVQGSDGSITYKGGVSSSVAGFGVSVVNSGPQGLITQLAGNLIGNLAERISGETARETRIAKWKELEAVIDSILKRNTEVTEAQKLLIRIGAYQQIVAQLKIAQDVLAKDIAVEQSIGGYAEIGLITNKISELRRQADQYQTKIDSMTIQLHHLMGEEGSLSAPIVAKFPQGYSRISDAQKRSMQAALRSPDTSNPRILAARAALERAYEQEGKVRRQSPVKFKPASTSSSGVGGLDIALIDGRRKLYRQLVGVQVEASEANLADVIEIEVANVEEIVKRLNHAVSSIEEADVAIRRALEAKRVGDAQPTGMSSKAFMSDNTQSILSATGSRVEEQEEYLKARIDLQEARVSPDNAMISTTSMIQKLIVLLGLALIPLGSMAQQPEGGRGRLNPNMYEKLGSGGVPAEVLVQGVQPGSNSSKLIKYYEEKLIQEPNLQERLRTLNSFIEAQDSIGFIEAARNVILKTKYPEVADRLLKHIIVDSEDHDIRFAVMIIDDAISNKNMVVAALGFQALGDLLIRNPHVLDRLSQDYFDSTDSQGIFARMSYKTARKVFITFLLTESINSEARMNLLRSSFWTMEELARINKGLSSFTNDQHVQDLEDLFSNEMYRREILFALGNEIKIELDGLSGEKAGAISKGSGAKGVMNSGSFDLLGAVSLNTDLREAVKIDSDRLANLRFLETSQRWTNLSYVYEPAVARAKNAVKQMWRIDYTESEGSLFYDNYQQIPAQAKPEYFMSLTSEAEKLTYIKDSPNLLEIARVLRVSNFLRKDLVVTRLMKAKLPGHVLLLNELNVQGDAFWPMISEIDWVKIITEDISKISDPTTNQTVSSALEKLYALTKNEKYLFLLTRLATDFELRKLEAPITQELRNAAVYRVAVYRGLKAYIKRIGARFEQISGVSQTERGESAAIYNILSRVNELDPRGLREYLEEGSKSNDSARSKVFEKVKYDAGKFELKLLRGEQNIPFLPLFQYLLLGGFFGALAGFKIRDIFHQRWRRSSLPDDHFNVWTEASMRITEEGGDKNDEAMSAKGALNDIDLETVWEDIRPSMKDWRKRYRSWNSNTPPEDVISDLTWIINDAKTVISRTAYTPKLMFNPDSLIANAIYFNTFVRFSAISFSAIYYFGKYAAARMANGKGLDAIQLKRAMQLIKQIKIIGKYGANYSKLLSSRGNIEKMLSYKLPKAHPIEWLGQYWFFRWVLGYSHIGSKCYADVAEGVVNVLKIGNTIMPGLYENEDEIITKSEELLNKAIEDGRSMFDPRPFKTRRSDRKGYYFVRVLSVLAGLGTAFLGVLGLLGVPILTAFTAEITVTHIVILASMYYLYWKTHLYSASSEEIDDIFLLLDKVERDVQRNTGINYDFRQQSVEAESKITIQIRKEEALKAIREEATRDVPNVDIVVFVPSEDAGESFLNEYLVDRKRHAFINPKAASMVINPKHFGSGASFLQIKNKINSLVNDDDFIQQYPNLKYLDGKRVLVVFHGPEASSQKDPEEQALFIDWSLARGYIAAAKAKENEVTKSGLSYLLDFTRELTIGEVSPVPSSGIRLTTSEVSRSSGALERAAYVYTALGSTQVMEVLYGMAIDQMELGQRTVLRGGKIGHLEKIFSLSKTNLEQFPISNGMIQMGPDAVRIFDRIIEEYLKPNHLWYGEQSFYLHFTIDLLIPIIMSSNAMGFRRDELFKEYILERIYWKDMEGKDAVEIERITQILQGLYTKIGEFYDANPFKIEEYRLPAVVSKYFRVEGPDASIAMQRIREAKLRLADWAMATAVQPLKEEVSGKESLSTTPGGIDISRTRDTIMFKNKMMSSSKGSVPVLQDASLLKNFVGFDFQIIQFAPIVNPEAMFLGSAAGQSGTWFNGSLTALT